jgi:hypothetical protein
MPDEPKKGEDYEVHYIVEESGITLDQARDLVKHFGSNRQALLREAKKLKK